MHLKFRGALTFDSDQSLENGMQVIEEKVNEVDSNFLTMEHIETLGLHVTVTHSGNATDAQVYHSRDVLETLAGLAYSGYVDMIKDETEQERFHAKEISPKQVSVEDIAAP